MQEEGELRISRKSFPSDLFLIRAGVNPAHDIKIYFLFFPALPVFLPFLVNNGECIRRHFLQNRTAYLLKRFRPSFFRELACCVNYYFAAGFWFCSTWVYAWAKCLFYNKTCGIGLPSGCNSMK